MPLNIDVKSVVITITPGRRNTRKLTPAIADWFTTVASPDPKTSRYNIG
jgi:hypothetical protein